MYKLLGRLILRIWPDLYREPRDGAAVPGMEEELSWLDRMDGRGQPWNWKEK